MADSVITNTQLAVSLGRVEEQVRNMAEDLHRIETTIDGFINGSNGRPGVMERIALSEQTIVGLGARVTAIESHGREQARLSWKALASVIALAGTLATCLVEALKHL